MPGRNALTFSVGALVALTGVAVFGLGGAYPDGAAALSVSALGTELFLAGIALGGASISPLTPARRLGLDSGRLPAGSIALLALGTVALSHGLDGLLQATGLREDSVIGEIDERLSGARGGTLVLAILGIGIAPGVAEEMLCRGWIQRGLERRIGAPLAIAAATLVFGVLHGESVHGAAAAGLGAYLGVVAWLAGSIRASILCHTANNLAAVLTLAWGIPTGLSSLWSLPLGFGVAAASLAVVWRRAGSPEPSTSGPELESDGDSHPPFG